MTDTQAPAVLEPAPAPAAGGASASSRLLATLRRHPTAIAGAVVLAAMVIAAVLAPWLGTTDPLAVSPIRRLRPPGGEWWFGTDMLGRDVYSREIGRASCRERVFAVV